MEKQRTLATSAQYSGIGLHTGNHTTVTFKPAEANTGICFVRTDLPEPVVIPATVENVTLTLRGTTLGIGDVIVHTVEHVMASLHGLGVDNAIVEIDSNEPPAGDGSALPFVEAILSAGIVEQNAIRRYINVEQPIWLSDKDTHLVVLPDDDFKITFTVDYHHPLLKSQYGSFTIDKETFQREIAPARTYGFLSEVEELKAQGLIKGGSLDNAVVIADDRILNDHLRFDDEFVRHKILDLIGDMFLIGHPLKCHLVVARSGHKSNVELAKKLRKYMDDKTKQTRLVTAKAQPEVPELPKVNVSLPTELPITQDFIQKILPHRYPFLLVDKIVEMEDMRAVAVKCVTVNEPFFQGHFPGHPIMPGVLIIEAMAQATGVLMLAKPEHANKLAYLMGVESAKFRRPVVPGDQLKLEVVVVKAKGRSGKAKGTATVDGKVVAEAEMTFALIEAN